MTPALHNGTYTITSPTGAHRTFKIATARKGNLEGNRILSLMVGRDNENDYMGFAFVNDDGVAMWSKFRQEFYEKCAKMVWSMGTLGNESPYVKAGVTMEASKRCMKCNRKLTNPESLELGIGPECASRAA
ncbi:MAG: hypothetical protein CMB80_00995 [Flammeovirgaceae bacterium]|nr:hypothetical protein [Flammeovirgaceae bacterium]|tara:strand:- start:2240 stop:2632 length:393 start_codon:yes stop_codon:yes gene_type:complete